MMIASLPANVVERLLTLLDSKFIVHLPTLFRLPLCKLNHHVLRNAVERLSVKLDETALSVRDFSKVNGWFLNIEGMIAPCDYPFAGFSVELVDGNFEHLKEFRVSKLVSSAHFRAYAEKELDSYFTNHDVFRDVPPKFANFSENFNELFWIYPGNHRNSLRCSLEAGESTDSHVVKLRRAKLIPKDAQQQEEIFCDIGDQLPDLQALEIVFRHDIDDAFYSALASLKHLERLKIKSANGLESSVLQAIRLSCPSVRYVSLHHHLSLEFSELRDFLTLAPALQRFDCQHVLYHKQESLLFHRDAADDHFGIHGISSEGMKELLQEITDLKTVRLPKMDEPNECLFAVATNNPDLQTLHLGCVTADYDLGVGAVIARCSRLEKLIFSECKDHGVVAVLFLLVRYLHLATVSEAFLDAQHGLDIHIRTCANVLSGVTKMRDIVPVVGVVLGMGGADCIAADAFMQDVDCEDVAELVAAVAQLDCCKSMEQAALPKHRRFSWRVVIARSSWSYKTLRMFHSYARLAWPLMDGALDGLSEFEIDTVLLDSRFSADHFALEVARRSPNLTRLSLNKSHRGYLTDRELMEMADKAPHLQYLALGHCDKLTVASVEYVLQRCTSLAVLEIPKSIVASAHVDRLETLFGSRLKVTDETSAATLPCGDPEVDDELSPDEYSSDGLSD